MPNTISKWRNLSHSKQHPHIPASRRQCPTLNYQKIRKRKLHSCANDHMAFTRSVMTSRIRALLSRIWLASERRNCRVFGFPNWFRQRSRHDSKNRYDIFGSNSHPDFCNRYNFSRKKFSARWVAVFSKWKTLCRSYWRRINDGDTATKSIAKKTRYMCPVTHDALTNTTRVAYLKTS